MTSLPYRRSFFTFHLLSRFLEWCNVFVFLSFLPPLTNFGSVTPIPVGIKVVTPLFSIGGTARVILRSRRCAKGFLNYFRAIIEFLKVVFKDEIVKFSKNCGTCAIKESVGVKVKIMEFQKNNNINKLP